MLGLSNLAFYFAPFFKFYKMKKLKEQFFYWRSYVSRIIRNGAIRVYYSKTVRKILTFIIILSGFLFAVNQGILKSGDFPMIIAAIGVCQLIRSGNEPKKLDKQNNPKELPIEQNRAG